MNAADLFRILRRIASQNLGLKVVALALAVAAWWFVAGESKVLVSFTVPLEIRNVPKGLTVTNKPERQVEVRLSGPSSLLSGMRPSELSAGVDLSAARGGRQSFTLDDRAVKVPPGIKVQRIFPSSVEVILDRTERRMVSRWWPNRRRGRGPQARHEGGDRPFLGRDRGAPGGVHTDAGGLHGGGRAGPDGRRVLRRSPAWKRASRMLRSSAARPSA